MEIHSHSVEVINHRDAESESPERTTTTIKVELIIDKTKKMFVFLLDEFLLVFNDFLDNGATLMEQDFEKLWRLINKELKKQDQNIGSDELLSLTSAICLAVNGTPRKTIYTYTGPAGVYSQIRTKGTH